MKKKKTTKPITRDEINILIGAVRREYEIHQKSLYLRIKNWIKYRYVDIKWKWKLKKIKKNLE